MATFQSDPFHSGPYLENDPSHFISYQLANPCPSCHFHFCNIKNTNLFFLVYVQASNRFAAALVAFALFVTIVPFRYVVLFIFVEEFTKYSPMRRAQTERWMRRMREWWFSIPAAPVILQRSQEDKKKK